MTIKNIDKILEDAQDEIQSEKSSKKSSVKNSGFPAQANLHSPYETWNGAGRKELDKISAKSQTRKKLILYEEYLLRTRFSAQRK